MTFYVSQETEWSVESFFERESPEYITLRSLMVWCNKKNPTHWLGKCLVRSIPNDNRLSTVKSSSRPAEKIECKPTGQSASHTTQETHTSILAQTVLLARFDLEHESQMVRVRLSGSNPSTRSSWRFAAQRKENCQKFWLHLVHIENSHCRLICSSLTPCVHLGL